MAKHTDQSQVPPPLVRKGKASD